MQATDLLFYQRSHKDSIMLLYRVHLKGDISIGMYNAACSGNFFEMDGRHPGPSSDSMLRTAWNEISERNRGTGGPPQWWFGFGSLEQFSNWVYREEWWQCLTDEGYVISLINVPDDRCHLGYTQAVMHKHHSEIVTSVPVIEWETLRGAAQPRDTRRDYYNALQRYAEQAAIYPVELSQINNRALQIARLSEGDIYALQTGCSIAR